MKKVFSILIVISLILCLVGCEIETNENIKKTSDYDVRVWTDTETGVQYVIFNNNMGYAGAGGITPRLNADGTLYYTADKNEVQE